MKNKRYPDWVCHDCGIGALKIDRPKYKVWREEVGTSTFHTNTCDICGKKKFVTEPRDYHYPQFDKYLRHLKLKKIKEILK